MSEPVPARRDAPAASAAPASAHEAPMEALRETLHRGFGVVFAPFARLLGQAGVSPNQLSVAGAALNAAAAALVVAGRPVAAGALYLFGGGFDMMDGLLARITGRESALGAFLDSTLDRVSEGVVFAALAYVFAVDGGALDAAAVVLALLLSGLVSYVRARAEGLGLSCRVGLFTRPERVVLLAAGLMAGFAAEAVWLLAALSAFTVVQRVIHTGHQIAGTRP
jgi:CDP-diacylglycerol--glycerol-3-phosphate 3-phosphatidyltransferase